jgi:hypothetical protein
MGSIRPAAWLAGLLFVWAAALGGACSFSSDIDGVQSRDVVRVDTSGGSGSTDTGTPARDTGGGRDTASGDAAPPADTPATDAPPADADPTDAAPADAPGADVACTYTCTLTQCECRQDEHGCDLPECAECATLAPAAEAAAEAAATGCVGVDSCARFEWPICGSFGCFQRAVRADADLAALAAAAQAAAQASCAGYTCGCGPAEGVPACLDGTCRLCPPDCGASCEDLAATIDARIATLATGCTDDADCVVLPATPCELGTSVECHAFGVRADQTAALAGSGVPGLLAAYVDPATACDWADCDCQDTIPRCQAGVCHAATE